MDVNVGGDGEFGADASDPSDISWITERGTDRRLEILIDVEFLGFIGGVLEGEDEREIEGDRWLSGEKAEEKGTGEWDREIGREEEDDEEEEEEIILGEEVGLKDNSGAEGQCVILIHSSLSSFSSSLPNLETGREECKLEAEAEEASKLDDDVLKFVEVVDSLELLEIFEIVECVLLLLA